MHSTSTSQAAHHLIDTVGERGEAMLHNGVDTAHQAVNGLGGLSESARLLQADAAALRKRGIDSLREGGRMARRRAHEVGDRTVSYVRHEPVKSMLMAAAIGAGLMALLGLVSRRSGH